MSSIRSTRSSAAPASQVDTVDTDLLDWLDGDEEIPRVLLVEVWDPDETSDARTVLSQVNGFLHDMGLSTHLLTVADSIATRATPAQATEILKHPNVRALYSGH